MKTAEQVLQPAIQQQTAPSRVVSIDIFRGLTMALMIFVNDVGSVKGLPWWTYHVPAKVDAMSYVDMVYPFFLFIVGMSLPLAVKQRLKKDSSLSSLWIHVVTRSISLVVLGLIIANAWTGDKTRMGMAPTVWALLALSGAVLFWNVYDDRGRHRRLFQILRLSGLLLMVAMFAIFRRSTPDGGAAWIDFSYPEILGLIGLTYLAAAILYIPTRRWLWAPPVWFVLLVTLCAFSTAHWIEFPNRAPLYLWPFGNGAMACIVMAGAVTSSIFLGNHRWKGAGQKLLAALAFAAISFVAGWILTPLGISKIRATPTWCLYSIGAAIVLFCLLYWICDMRKRTAWAAFARPAGANTLTAYLVPDFYYFAITALGVTFFATHFGAGWPGVFRAIVFTGVMLALTALLTRWKVQLKL